VPKIFKKSNPSFETLKSLYPNIEVDPATRKRYRPIKKTLYPYADKNKGLSVDTKVFKLSIPGNKKAAYLLTGQPQTIEPTIRRLVVFTHSSFFSQDPTNIIHLKQGMPIIAVMGPHEEKLFTALSLVNNPYAKISPTQGIILSSKQAKKHFKELGYYKITGTTTPQAFYNYTLEKLETYPNKDYAKHYFEIAAAIMAELGQPFDVLTLRKSRDASKITVREILLIAQALSYDEITFNFCRVLSEAAKQYDAKMTQAASTPTLKSWVELGEQEPPSTISGFFQRLFRFK
jgi:hypothetical protein